MRDKTLRGKHEPKAVGQYGYGKALQLLRACRSEDGFLASTTEFANYRRIWARDGCVMGLAALMSEQEDLIDTCRDTLLTLARYQGPHGEIPSNVDTNTGRVSYGGMVGRVDADLWFVIVAGQYFRRSVDDEFLRQLRNTLERVRFLLGCWQLNTRGLLYVPLTGDWADEYIHNGYVLYDQLLYLQALREFSSIHTYIHGTDDHTLDDQISRLKDLITSNYWFKGEDETPEGVYHPVLFEKGRQARRRCIDTHWMPFFSPAGYGYRFDAFANVLASLLDVADETQREAVDRFIDQHAVSSEVMLLPAFHPVIEPKSDTWDELQVMFSYEFRNKPYEYHNGGLWPMITGFYVADLAGRGKNELARQYLNAIHLANARGAQEDAWSFPEYIHGRNYTAGGATRLGWSAAGAVIGHQALEGRDLFPLSEPKRRREL